MAAKQSRSTVLILTDAVRGAILRVSLALWMGADPRLRTRGLYEDADYRPSSALEDAYALGECSIAVLFELDPDVDDPTKLLGRAFRMDMRLVDRLLSHGARTNDKPNGGCSLLDRCFGHMWPEGRHGLHGLGGEANESGVRKLIERGARLVAQDAGAYRTIREVVCRIGSRGRKDFLRLLSGAAEPDVIFRILDTQMMRRHFGMPSADIMTSYRLKLPDAVAAKLERSRGRPRPVSKKPKKHKRLAGRAPSAAARDVPTSAQPPQEVRREIYEPPPRRNPHRRVAQGALRASVA